MNRQKTILMIGILVILLLFLGVVFGSNRQTVTEPTRGNTENTSVAETTGNAAQDTTEATSAADTEEVLPGVAENKFNEDDFEDAGATESSDAEVSSDIVDSSEALDEPLESSENTEEFETVAESTEVNAEISASTAESTDTITVSTEFTTDTEETIEEETTEENIDESNTGEETETAVSDYEYYRSLSGREQQAFIESFNSMEDFFVWYNRAKEEYEALYPDIEISDGTIDMGDLEHE